MLNLSLGKTKGSKERFCTFPTKEVETSPKAFLITKKNIEVNQKDKIVKNLCFIWRQNTFAILMVFWNILNKSSFPKSKYRIFIFSQGQLFAHKVYIYWFIFILGILFSHLQAFSPPHAKSCLWSPSRVSLCIFLQSHCESSLTWSYLLYISSNN